MCTYGQGLPIKKHTDKITILVFQCIFPGFLAFLWLVARLCWQQIFYQGPLLFPGTPALAHYILTPPNPPLECWGNLPQGGTVCCLLLCGLKVLSRYLGSRVRGLCPRSSLVSAWGHRGLPGLGVWSPLRGKCRRMAMQSTRPATGGRMCPRDAGSSKGSSPHWGRVHILVGAPLGAQG